MTRPRMILAAADPGLTLAAPAAAVVDTVKRTISGLAVPYGKAGQTSLGVLTFAQGSLSWSGDLSRIKLLHEHDQRVDVVGYAIAVDDQPDGLHATYYVPTVEESGSDAGDKALASAAAKLRDGLSVGVQPDARTTAAIRKANATAGAGPVAATGALRETSLVAIPAFDDARVSSVAASAGDGLVVSSWSDQTPTGGNPMLCSSCQTAHALGLPCPITATAGNGDQGAGTGAPAGNGDQGAGTGAPAGNGDQGAGTGAPAGNGDQGAGTGGTPPATPGPAIVPAAAGMAITHVVSEPSAYGFGLAEFGSASVSLLADAAGVAFDRENHADAAARIARFNQQLVAGNPASVMALAAVAVTDDLPAGVYNPQTYRPDLLVRVIDAGRPIVSRLTRIPITNATPFAIPTEGEFDGVADHTEGTAHNGEGTLGLGGDVVQPKAVSGAYKLSRELVDSTNPAVDRVALPAMLRDYRRLSEDKVIAAIVAADAAATLSIDGVIKLQGELVDFVDDDGNGANFVAMSRTFAKAMATDLDADDRPYLNTYGQSVNAPGSATVRKAGSAGYEIEGAELVRAFRMAADTAALIRSEGVLFAESATQTFRFDQPEGPGVIKFAIWGYVGSKVLPTPVSGLPWVTRVTKAAA